MRIPKWRKAVALSSRTAVGLAFSTAVLLCFGARAAANPIVWALGANPAEDCSTQMNIGWHAAPEYTNCFVAFTKKSDTAWAQALNVQGTSTSCDTFNGVPSKTASNADFSESAVFLDYGAALAGLQPDTEYMYKVCAGTNCSAVHYFKTAGAAEFSFVWFGDSHVYAPIPSRQNNALMVIDAALARDPGVDFIFSTGDIAAWGGSYSFWTNFYAQDFVRNYMLAGVLGNHDNMTRNHRANPEFFRVMHNFPGNGYSGQEGVCYWFLYHDVLFLTFNNEAMNGKPDEQLAAKNWAAEVIRNQKGRYRHIFIAQHYQWFYGTDGRTSWYANWKDFCDEHAVTLALSGNNHIYLRTRPLYKEKVTSSGKGTVYMQVPSCDGERGVKAGRLTENAEKIAFTYASDTVSGNGMVRTIGCVLVTVGEKTITTKLVYLDDQKLPHVADEHVLNSRGLKPSRKRANR